MSYDAILLKILSIVQTYSLHKQFPESVWYTGNCKLLTRLRCKLLAWLQCKLLIRLQCKLLTRLQCELTNSRCIYHHVNTVNYCMGQCLLQSTTQRYLVGIEYWARFHLQLQSQIRYKCFKYERIDYVGVNEFTNFGHCLGRPAIMAITAIQASLSFS